VQAPFSLFLALRYLRPKRTVVSIITLISIAGVALGVWGPIIVISVMTGFDQTIRRAILGFEPHLRVTNGGVLQNWQEYLPRIEKVPGVVGAAPYVQGPVLIEYEGHVNPAILRGVNASQEQKLIDLKKYIIPKVAEGQDVVMESDTVILGKTLAEDLGARVGDEVTIYAPGNIRGILDELRRETEDPNAKPKTLAEIKGDVVIPAPMKVVGLIDSGTNAFDANFVLCPLSNAQELYSLKNGIHGLGVKTADPYDLKAVQHKIEAAMDGNGFTISWMEENRQRLEAVQTERVVMYLIMLVASIVAAFCIMNTVIVMTVQKTREIGIMKALGARPGQIIWVFLSYGMFIGLWGVSAGLGAGLLALHYRNDFKDWLSNTLGMEFFPAGIYEFSKIPAELRVVDISIICGGAFLCCIIAALIPAFLASQLDPVKALRSE